MTRYPDSGRPWRVVIAEDQPFDRAEAKAALRRGSSRRYTFVECETAAEAVAAVRDAADGGEHVDCLLLDYQLPDAEAPDVLARLPRCAGTDLPAVPVVVVTGADGGPGGADRSRAVLGAGAQDFVGKDWLTPASLTRSVEAAVERHRTDLRLREQKRAFRESEERYRTLFEAVDVGFCILEIVYDEAGGAVDYRFLETNPAFVEQTGLADAVGRTAYELVPGLERHWVETYARVVETGEPVRFEQGSAAMGRLFEVSATRVGGAGSRRVALLFSDVTQRRRAQAAVQESEVLFRNLANAAPALLWTTEPDGSCTFLSQGWYDYTGQTEAEGLGFGWLDAVHPDDADATGEAFRTATAERSPFRVDYRLRRHDGVYRWAIDAGQPRFGEDGAFAGFVGSVIDIHDRKQAEARTALLAETGRLVERALDTEATLREIARVAVPGFADWCAVDLVQDDGSIAAAAIAHADPAKVEWAAALRERQPVDPEAPTGVPNVVRTGVPEVYVDIPDEVLVAAAEDEEHLKILREVGFSSVVVVPLRAGGEVTGAVTFVQAESGRRFEPADVEAAEEIARRAGAALETGRLHTALREAEEYLRSAVAAAEVGTWRVDLATGLDARDPLLNRILGLPAEPSSLPADDFFGRVHPEDRPAVDAAWTAALAGADGYDVEHRVVRPDGTVRWVRDRGRVLAGSDGAPRHVTGALADITERKEAELRGQFLVALDDAVRPLNDPDDVTRTAARLLGEHLRADRCAYALVEPDQDSMEITGDYTRTPEVRSIVGRWRFSDFGAEVLRLMRENRPFVADDVDAHEPPVGDKEAYRQTQIQAVVCVPLHKGGRFAAGMAVHSATPRRWTPAEVELVQTVAARCWESIERARVNRDLHESEEQFRRAVEEAPIPVIMHAEDGEVLQVSRSWSRLTGFELEDVESFDAWLTAAYGFGADDVRARVRGLFDGASGPVEAEFEIVTRGGERRTWIFSASSPGALRDGRRFVVGMALDITERKRAERALRESDERVRLATEAAGLGLWVWHPEEDRVTWENDRGYEILGFERAEHVNAARFAAEFVHPDDAEAFGAALAGTAESGVPFRFEGRFYRTDGALRWVEFTGKPVFGPDGSVRQLLGTTADITERKEAETALRESEELVRTIAENSTQALIMMDARGYLTYCNAAWLEMTGYSAEEIRSEPLHDLVHHHYPDGRPYPMEECPIDRALPENFDVRAHEDLFFRKDGSTFPVLCAASPIFEDGRPVSTVLEVRDMTAFHEAQQALRESEERLAFALRAADLGPWELDLATGEATGSPRHDEIFGYPEGLPTWSAGQFFDHLLPEHRPAAEAAFERVLAGESDFNVECRIRRADGAVRWIAARGRRSPGATQRMIGTVADVTERKEAETALRESEATLNAILDALPVGVVIADARGALVRDNEANRELWGVPPETANWEEYGQWVGYWPDSGRRIAADEWAMARALRTGETIRGELVENERFGTGEHRFFLNNAAPIFDAEGALVGGVVAELDVTDRLAAERTLRESQARLELALGGAELGTWDWDLVSDRVVYDRRWASMLGYNLDELAQTPATWERLIHADDAPAVEEALTDHLEGRRPGYEAEFRMRTAGGGWRWILARGRASGRGPDGRPTRIAGTHLDVTDRKEAEAALRRLNDELEDRIEARTAELGRSNAELDQFAYVASHDLKAPLRAIDSLATWIEEDAAGVLPDESLRHLALLRARVGRMEGLLESLLAYSRVGRKESAPEPVDTGDLVADVLALVAPPEGFDVRVEGDFPTAVTARAPLELVVRNLVSNAIKHHDDPEHGHVTVSAEAHGDWATFTVADDGPGIPPEYQDRVFGLFQTLRPRDEVEGSGMGLAIVKKTVESRGGAIRLASDGRGATFQFTWPLHTPAP